MTLETTVFPCRGLGSVLLLRGLSILLDRQQVVAMLQGLEKEATCAAFFVMPSVLLTAAPRVAQEPVLRCSLSVTPGVESRDY